MFVRVKKLRRKHGLLFQASLCWTDRVFDRVRQNEAARIASIREHDIDDVQLLYNFWNRIYNFCKMNFSDGECSRFYASIMRHIKRPRRIIGGESGIYFLYYGDCSHYTKHKSR